MRCTDCGELLENAGDNPSEPPLWECRNHRCIRCVLYRDDRCPKCGKPPTEITSTGMAYTDFLCGDGHRFAHDFHKK